MDFWAFEKSVTTGKVKSLYLVTGDEPTLIERATTAIVRKAEMDYPGIELVRFDLAEVDPEALELELRSNSLFARQRIAVLRRAGHLKGKKLEGLARLLDLAGKDLVICVQAAGPVGRRAGGREWQKNLKALSSKVERLKGISVECRRPSQREVPAVVRRCLESRGLEATASAVQQIADFVGEDVGAMEDAAERLLLWLGGPGKVDEEQVERVVRASRFHSVFELTDAVGEGNTRAAVRVLHASFRQGETPLALLGQLARHLRNLVRVGGASRRLGSDLQKLQAEVGLHPYVIKKCLAQSRRFGARRLGQLLEAVARADVELKSSRLPAELIMERLVMELAGSSARNR